MNAQKINTALISMLGTELSDWEREELAEKLVAVPKDILREIMSNLPVIWPVSYALFLAFVDQAIRAGGCLKPYQYRDWVKAILDVYEAEGLRQAQLFMESVEDNYICQIQGRGGLRLDECEANLSLYARSILGRDVTFISGSFVSFDTQILQLPAEVSGYENPDKCFLFYKFILTFQLQLDILGTYRFPTASINQLCFKGDSPDDYCQFFNGFSNKKLAKDLFLLAEAVRIISSLQKKYPGLIRDVQEHLELGIRFGAKAARGQNSLVFAIEHWVVTCISNPADLHGDDFPMHDVLSAHYENSETVLDSLKCTQRLYVECVCEAEEYLGSANLSFIGELCFDKAQVQIEQRRETLRNKFINALGEQMYEVLKKPDALEDTQEQSIPKMEDDTGTLLLLGSKSEDIEKTDLKSNQETIRIGNMEVDVSDELSGLTRELFKEFGKIPGDFIASSAGRAGDLFDATPDEGPENSEHQVSGAVLYDEWDYRRAGYRKNWCKVISKEVQPAKGTFVETTLKKHKGLLVTLRRQFEMMSIQEKFEKRQREGDEIDLDALIDSVSDSKAGLPPSERLFIRLQRNDRQIAALFLVDMSSSTEGWVSTALKEALILMSESLAALGDRYAIYGFSGMRRTRSDFFTVKGFDEPYDDEVKSKIAGISPKEYTRMAPAIRHASHILENTQAKIRLLITLSDGKPEDYDGYKGMYAIEDTRHALIEAKNSGIHPFCITVDKEAHDYMAHMYGEVNYIFIDNLAKLPVRMPEIYRNLTT